MAVTDDHLVVAAAVVDPVVVTFDGQYVWSFVPRRDGDRTRHGWRVAWPAAITRPARRHGLRAAGRRRRGAGVLRGRGVVPRQPRPLLLRDPHGHPLAVDKAGHLTRVFSETDGDVRRQIAEGTARAIADLRDHVGHRRPRQLRLPARRRPRRPDDRARLRRRPRLPEPRGRHPADVVRESFRIEREMRELGWKVVRMSGADLKLFLPLPDGRVVHVDVFGAFHVEGIFYQLGGRSGALDRDGADPRLDRDARGRRARRAGRPGGACWSSSTGRAGACPTRRSSRSTRGPACAGSTAGCAASAPHVVALERDLPRPPRTRSPAGAPRSRSGRSTGCPRRDGRRTSAPGTGRDSAWFARRGHRVVAVDFSGAALRHTRRRLAAPGVDRARRPRAAVQRPAGGAARRGRARPRAGAAVPLRPRAGRLPRRGRARATCGGCARCRCAGAGRSSWSTPPRDPACAARHREGLVKRVSTRRLVREITAAGGVVVAPRGRARHDFFDRARPPRRPARGPLGPRLRTPRSNR